MNSVSVSFEYTFPTDDGGELVFWVEASVTKPRPAISRGGPDSWEPADGGEVEDLQIYSSDGTVRLTDAQLKKLGIFLEDVEKEAFEHAFGRYAAEPEFDPAEDR